MSAPAWDRLSDWMVNVALIVDQLKVVIFWTLLLAVVIWLAAWFLKVLSRSGVALPDEPAGGSWPPTFLDHLDERACIAISRRPRRRKRRHHRRRERRTTLMAV